MVGNMYGPEQAATMVHKMLQPKEEVLAYQQHYPIHNRIPPDIKVIPVDKIE
jgi:hypothetical protein